MFTFKLSLFKPEVETKPMVTSLEQDWTVKMSFYPIKNVIFGFSTCDWPRNNCKHKTKFSLKKAHGLTQMPITQ